MTAWSPPPCQPAKSALGHQPIWQQHPFLFIGHLWQWPRTAHGPGNFSQTNQSCWGHSARGSQCGSRIHQKMISKESLSDAPHTPPQAWSQSSSSDDPHRGAEMLKGDRNQSLGSSVHCKFIAHQEGSRNNPTSRDPVTLTETLIEPTTPI